MLIWPSIFAPDRWTAAQPQVAKQGSPLVWSPCMLGLTPAAGCLDDCRACGHRDLNTQLQQDGALLAGLETCARNVASQSETPRRTSSTSYCNRSTPFFPDDGLDIPEDHAVAMGADALRPRVLAAHNAAMDGAAAAAAAARQQDGGGGGLRVSVAGDGADSSLADSSRDVSPSGRTSKKRAPQSLTWHRTHVYTQLVPSARATRARPGPCIFKYGGCSLTGCTCTLQRHCASSSTHCLIAGAYHPDSLRIGAATQSTQDGCHCRAHCSYSSEP